MILPMNKNQIRPWGIYSLEVVGSWGEVSKTILDLGGEKFVQIKKDGTSWWNNQLLSPTAMCAPSSWAILCLLSQDQLCVTPDSHGSLARCLSYGFPCPWDLLLLREKLVPVWRTSLRGRWGLAFLELQDKLYQGGNGSQVQVWSHREHWRTQVVCSSRRCGEVKTKQGSTVETWVSQVLTGAHPQWGHLKLGQENQWWAYLIKHLGSGSLQLSLSEPQVFVQSLPEPELWEPRAFVETCMNTLAHEKSGNKKPSPPSPPQSKKIPADDYEK